VTAPIPVAVDDSSPDPIGQSWEIAILLTDGPRTCEEIEDGLRAWGPRINLFVPDRTTRSFHARGERARRHRRSPAWLSHSVRGSLHAMVSRGWATADAERYFLTELGRRQAERALDVAHATIGRRRTLLTAEYAARATLVVQVVLALLKVPAALLSGSVAQLNDAADTMLDLFSSVVVYVGMRLGRERVVSIVLVLLMLGTGAFTLLEALGRMLNPTSPALSPYPTAVAIGSIGVYGLLWAYQRYVGLHADSLALVTQSVDSRNHVIVAFGVTAGLVTAPLRLSLVDAVVGLGIAVLILRSAVELAIDMVRSGDGEDPGLGRYGFWIGDWLATYRRNAFRDWLLYLLAQGNVRTEMELIARAKLALARQDNRLMREFGPNRVLDFNDLVASLRELHSEGWISGSETLEATASGRRHLRRWLQPPAAAQIEPKNSSILSVRSRRFRERRAP
jgi:hypothetical protein